ncbi:MAG: hypothetical protein R3362_09495 [Rhodothermales bacterium]|nr:hypothetical protein [Rhodothermales bacterium]
MTGLRLSVLVLIAAVVGSAPGSAQPRFPTPHRLPLDPAAAAPSTTSRLFPAGWSAVGAFAYVYRRAPEAGEEGDWVLRVQDLRSDRLLAEMPLGNPLTDDPFGNRTLADAWAEHGTRIDSLLDAHAVVPADTLVLRPFPARLGPFQQTVLEAEVRTTPGTDPDFGYDGIAGLTLGLVQNRTARKRIHSERFPRYLPLGAGVLGYLESPHEERIAVVLGLVRRGWEGPPNVLDYRIVGAGVGAQF